MRPFNVILAFTLVLSACGTEEKSDSTVPTSVVSAEQSKLAGVRTGNLEHRLISRVISCTGEIEIPPRGMASVTAPLGGYIMDTDMVPGIFVKKGAVLAKLSNPEYIVLQQSYMETSGQLKFAAQEYERQRLLDEQNATAAKKFQESESLFSVLKARLAGLKEQLRMIGINFQDLESGNIQSVVSLRAPITGYVTHVNHHPGQFVEPREVIFEIVDTRDLHLHLNVFEQDISNVSKGQTIRFHPAGAKHNSFSGLVSLVSPRKADETRTFDVHGHIETGGDKLKPGMYVEAQILVSDDSVYALPESAIVNSNNNNFIIVKRDDVYKIHAIETGRRMDGWVEIPEPGPFRSKNIVTEGTSRLFTALSRTGQAD